MLDDAQLGTIGIGWIDHDQVWAKVRLELRGEDWVGHHDCCLYEANGGIQFLRAGFGQAGNHYTKEDLCFVELQCRLRIAQQET